MHGTALASVIFGIFVQQVERERKKGGKKDRNKCIVSVFMCVCTVHFDGLQFDTLDKIRERTCYGIW